MDKQDFYQNARFDIKGPLDGVRVVEATTMWAGPMAGCVFADLGAEVIKVEHPKGEVCRTLPPFLPNSTLTVPHETVNRNKKSVTLDLKCEKGQEIFLKLCGGSDLVVENFKPGTLASWGLGYEELRQVKKDIIYVSISMFGQFGPYSDRPGYDPLAQNFTGWSSLNGDIDGQPTKAPTFLADDLAGLHAVIGAMAALNHRNNSGEGQQVDISLVDSLLFQSNGCLTSGKLGMPLERAGNKSSIAAPVNGYKCSDGSIYVAVLLDAHWKAFCSLIRRDELSGMGAAERKREMQLVDKIMAGWCRSRTVKEATSKLTEIGLAVTKVNTFSEAASHSQIKSRDMLQETELVDGSRIPLTGPAAKFSRTPTKIRSGAPQLGRDNSAILQSLGFSIEDIVAFKKEDII
jgi:formyl-CoA transferase